MERERVGGKKKGEKREGKEKKNNNELITARHLDYIIDYTQLNTYRGAEAFNLHFACP